MRILTFIAVLALSFTTAFAGDALHEVNAARQKRGLRPFKPDPSLTLAAEYCCKYRTKNGIAGHVRLPHSDMYFIPRRKDGTPVYKLDTCTAGVACWEQDIFFKGKWGACCTYGNYTYAGAWAEIGEDGNRYMQLFVR